MKQTERTGTWRDHMRLTFWITALSSTGAALFGLFLLGIGEIAGGLVLLGISACAAVVLVLGDGLCLTRRPLDSGSGVRRRSSLRR